jgi:dTDP-4-dehydrorhamnose reductase
MRTEPPALLFGATSIIGFTVARLFPERVTPVANPFNGSGAAAAWRQVCVEDAAWVRTECAQPAPPLVIYCHAVCDVAKCEADPGWAQAINVGGVRTLLELLPAATRFVYVSSDHVFGGDGTYTEDATPSPISVYGRTRVAAERCVLARPGSLVIRAGLPIGASLNRRSPRWRAAPNKPCRISGTWRSAAATPTTTVIPSHRWCRRIGSRAGPCLTAA